MVTCPPRVEPTPQVSPRGEYTERKRQNRAARKRARHSLRAQGVVITRAAVQQEVRRLAGLAKEAEREAKAMTRAEAALAREAAKARARPERNVARQVTRAEDSLAEAERRLALVRAGEAKHLHPGEKPLSDGALQLRHRVLASGESYLGAAALLRVPVAELVLVVTGRLSITHLRPDVLLLAQWNLTPPVPGGGYVRTVDDKEEAARYVQKLRDEGYLDAAGFTEFDSDDWSPWPNGTPFYGPEPLASGWDAETGDMYTEAGIARRFRSG